MMHTNRLLILGASTRSAAFSAIRSGFKPVCADNFEDQDLRAVADVIPIEGYPSGLVNAAARAPHSPWMYTGALENRPQLIEKISRSRTLWGNGPEILRVVRNQQQIARILQQENLPFLETHPESDPPPPDGTWLLKPSSSNAGHGIFIWDKHARGARTLAGSHYFQRRAHGTPMSALYLAFPSTACLIGASRQWIGQAQLNAPSFRYCGSIGPIQFPPPAGDQLRRIGRTIAAASGIRGLFGCDFLYDGTTFWLTEVNPRYTASVEIFERAWQLPLLKWHCSVCAALQNETNQTTAEELQGDFLQVLQSGTERVIGKAILFAARSFAAPDLLDLFPKQANHLEPSVADIPTPGTWIYQGHPVCTIFAEAVDPDVCQRKLTNAAHDLYQGVLSVD